ncbi:LPXTG cell wall anchor domain-containing protein [Micromonospora narathiwatensis]|uniref:LPXTG-motif cell wall anchor domain-containing protein n=1 Tax=Micromonospora narathiwatensis TaxID=299146 RepID=A0A1A9ABZ5_9ACTN|nr:LPXTG cell wall anchor domain-containing protein [Micromonospora narathiwatensis]SBT53680.1 LPXTG-motif cell wall anchor domain-containing protein [Micromonospora narathiwatensis]
MLSNSTRRWLAGLGVAGAFVAASATPAAAAPPANDVLLYANNALVAPGGEARNVTLLAYAEALPKKLTLTIDRTAVQGFASVTLTDRLTGCKEAGAVITCALDDENVIDYVVDLTVKADDKAEVGAKGDVVLSLAGDGRKATTRATVEIGEGVDLAAGPDITAAGAPGTTIAAPITVANIGDTTSHGTVLLLATMEALAPAKRHSNCSYLDGFGSHFAQCTFDDDIAPGTGMRLDGSSGLRIAPDAWAPGQLFGFASWYAKGDWEEIETELKEVDGWQQGTGAPLKLVPASNAQVQALRQTDKDTTNNGTGIEVEVTGEQRADVAAIGAELPGTVGRTVQAKVGFVNNGPAMTNSYSPGGEIVTIAQVSVPAGATVVTAPVECSDDIEGGPSKPGAKVYFCEWFETLHKGDKALFEFGLRIDKVDAAPGSVKLIHFDLESHGPVADLNPRNDTAALVIKGNGGQGGGDGGDGGTLPITGSSTGLIAGIGALLLAAGAGGYVIARRRKTRFVA